MFRKGPRPFYKLGDGLGLLSPPAECDPTNWRPAVTITTTTTLPTSRREAEMVLPRVLQPPADTTADYRRPSKPKALFVDSAFFSSRDHPTWEQQVKMARRIAASLSDATNRHSRGQTMYERRQKRSPRWIHQGGVPLTSEDYRGPTLTVQTKPLLELVVNPQGQLLDLESLRDKGVIINTESLSPELCAELISDLHSGRGRGGQIFARRRKRAERWVVDEFHPEPTRPGERPTTQLPRPRPRHTEPEPELRPPALQTTRHDATDGGATLTGPSVTVAPIRLDDLWQPAAQSARFPTDGVYSPRAPQGWRSQGTDAPFSGPVFAERSESPALDWGTASDTALDYGTLPDTAPADTWDQQQHQQQQQQQRRPPPPAAALFETPIESLRAMEERRRQGRSIYTPHV